MCFIVWHEPESSHLELLEAAAGHELLERSTGPRSHTDTNGMSSATSISSCRETAVALCPCMTVFMPTATPLEQMESRGLLRGC